MLLLNPKNYQDRNYPDDRSKEIMVKTIEWFESKGMKKNEGGLPVTGIYL